jgi:hypothetical protein
MKRRFLIAGMSVLLAGLAGCSSCGKQDRSLLSLIPADAAGAVILPDLAQTVLDTKALMDKFSVGPLATFINQGHIEVGRILGFDPLKIEDLRKLGLAPELGVAVVPVGDQAVLIAGVGDRKALEREITERMKQLAAAEKSATSTLDGLAVTTVSTRIGEQESARLHYAFVGSYVLLAWAPTEAKQLARLAGLTREQSLEAAGWYQALAAKAPKQSDLLLVINAAQPGQMGPDAKAVTQFMRDGLVLALAFDAAGFDTELYLGLESKTAARLNALTSAVVDAHLERYLPADTVMAFKARMDLGKGLEELFGLDPEFQREYQDAMQAARQATGSDLEQASVRNLTGNLAVGFSLGKADQINQLLSHFAEQPVDTPADKGPLPAAFQLYTWAQIRDAAAWAQVIDNLLPLATERSQLQVAKTQIGPLKVYQLAGGQLGTSLYLLQKDDLIGGCLGEGCQTTAADLVAGKGKSLATAVSPGAKRLFDEPSLAVGYLNCGLVFEALSGLDANALGDGGMLAKMALDLALTAVRNLKELTGVIRFLPEGVALSSRLDIQ